MCVCVCVCVVCVVSVVCVYCVCVLGACVSNFYHQQEHCVCTTNTTAATNSPAATPVLSRYYCTSPLLLPPILLCFIQATTSCFRKFVLVDPLLKRCHQSILPIPRRELQTRSIVVGMESGRGIESERDGESESGRE